MKKITVERNNASRRNNQRIARIRTGVTDQIVGAFFLVMIDDPVLRAAARMRQDVNRAVLFIHCIQRAE